MSDRFAVVIAGTRYFDDYDLLKEKCDYFFSNKWPTSIICGEAAGADTLGKKYAMSHRIHVQSFPANWDKYGKKAGYIRNEQMADNADAVIVFWDGISRGSKNMIDIAHERGIPCRVVRYK